MRDEKVKLKHESEADYQEHDLVLFAVFVVLGVQSFFAWIVPTFQHIEQLRLMLPIPTKVESI